MPEIARGGSHKVPMSSVFRAKKGVAGGRHPKTAARLREGETFFPPENKKVIQGTESIQPITTILFRQASRESSEQVSLWVDLPRFERDAVRGLLHR